MARCPLMTQLVPREASVTRARSTPPPPRAPPCHATGFRTRPHRPPLWPSPPCQWSCCFCLMMMLKKHMITVPPTPTPTRTANRLARVRAPLSARTRPRVEPFVPRFSIVHALRTVAHVPSCLPRLATLWARRSLYLYLMHLNRLPTGEPHGRPGGGVNEPPRPLRWGLEMSPTLQPFSIIIIIHGRGHVGSALAQRGAR